MEKENLNVTLIELNPFSKASGAGLFSWIEDI